jgi:hypothetical protein
LKEASDITRKEKTEHIGNMPVSGSLTSDGARIDKKITQGLLEWKSWSKKSIPKNSIFNGDIDISSARLNSPGEYWIVFHEHFQHFGGGCADVVLSAERTGRK